MYFKAVSNSLKLEIYIPTKDNVCNADKTLSFIKKYIKRILRKRFFMGYNAYY